MSYQNLLRLCALSLVLFACGQAAPAAAPAGGAAAMEGAPVSVGAGQYYNLTPQELAKMLENKDFFFVNSHIPYEGELAQTDAFIPYDQTEALLDQFPPDKSARIVIYCRSGRMSAITAEVLVKAGYTHVWNLDGGWQAWERAGYEVIK